MKYFYTITATSMLACACGIASMCADIQRDRAAYKAALGRQISIGSESVTIVDYSTFSRTFTLSNGEKISRYYLNSK